MTESRKFSERLEDAVARYHANAITAAEVIQELIALAKEIRAARQRGEEQGLTDEEIAEAAKIASRVKPDFIKTSTGFGTGGATAAHVAIMKGNCGADVQVKASGGIRSWEEAKAMLEAGATRLGVSAGMKIIAEM